MELIVIMIMINDIVAEWKQNVYSNGILICSSNTSIKKDKCPYAAVSFLEDLYPSLTDRFTSIWMINKPSSIPCNSLNASADTVFLSTSLVPLKSLPP